MIEVAKPRVEGSRVHFSWTGDGLGDICKVSRFSIDYEGLPVDELPIAIHWSSFLTLMLPVFSIVDAPRVEVRFESPVPAAIFEFWSRWLGVSNVVGTPLDGSSPPSVEANGSKAAVFFGGGKDSSLAYAALAEREGPANVVLVQFAHSFRRNWRWVKALAERQENIMLAPARDLGVTTQTVHTDFLSILTMKGRSARPSGNLYFGAGVPALILQGCSFATVSFEFMGFWTHDALTGATSFGNVRGRPEFLERLTRFHEHVLGLDIIIGNVNYPISPLVAYKTTLERYSEHFARMVMCVNSAVPAERWCYNCKKCLEYATFGLFYGYVDREFDYHRLFAESEHLTKVLLRAGAKPKPWIPGLCTDYHISTVAHVFASMAMPEDLIVGKARARLDALRDSVLSVPCRGVETIPQFAVDRLRCGREQVVAIAAAEHAPVDQHWDHALRVGHRPVIYDPEARASW